ncbi:kynurenine 3-monooxygenase [Anopheles bellator]|uniref:kynurenine 3-monooxygenase n=1 Tax=Anopheles bellator TaxID=139047 RepID=UPI002647B93E|nr:kynurenine 3-monooxygenase [Anopheles bellator]
MQNKRDFANNTNTMATDIGYQYKRTNTNGYLQQPLDIAIVGGGLVGSLLALHLGKKGHEVNLYEYREDIRTAELVLGRSINLALSARGRRALAEVGLEEALLGHGIPMAGRMLHDLSGQRKVVPYDANTKQCIYSVGRKHLNEVLLNAAEKYPNIHLNFNHKLVSADLDEGHFSMIDPTTKEIKNSQADLIVGCDGAYSAVRKEIIKRPRYDFSQTYIEHGYLELCIPPLPNGEFAMPHNYLHIWPRGKFMMIALPNQDRTWTVTLFMPFTHFNSITDADSLLSFFRQYFPDAIDLIGRERLIKDFFKIKPQSLVMIKCRPYHVGTKALIVGDAAHAMVPFYGQGMNAGFEDCSLLTELFSKYGTDLGRILPEFSERRWADAHSICDLAMYNYIEMRDLVTKRSYLLRKKLDEILFWLLPNTWVPLYNSVSFSHMPYSQCIANRAWQDKILTRAIYGGSVVAAAAIGTLCYRYLNVSHLERLSASIVDAVKLLKPN